MPLRKIIRAALFSSKTEIIIFVVGVFSIILANKVFIEVCFALAMISGYIVLKIYRRQGLFRRLEEAGLIANAEEARVDIFNRRLFNVIKDMRNRYSLEVSSLSEKIENQNAVFSQLFHGMKSSIAVIRLISEKASEAGYMNDVAISDIMYENDKLKNSMEQALNMIRLDAFVNDYLPERIELADLVSGTINEHKRDFIYNGIYPKLDGNDVVYTDHKWCGFIISQLISNSIKYSENGHNLFFDIEKCGDMVELHITDNGIGIPPADLPRIFSMFYTGANGRKRKDSTGVGLFMVKHIADKLGITIGIDSAVNIGTTVTLSFPDFNAFDLTKV
jgi:hypothetical protein